MILSFIRRLLFYFTSLITVYLILYSFFTLFLYYIGEGGLTFLVLLYCHNFCTGFKFNFGIMYIHMYVEHAYILFILRFCLELHLLGTYFKTKTQMLHCLKCCHLISEGNKCFTLQLRVIRKIMFFYLFTFGVALLAIFGYSHLQPA